MQAIRPCIGCQEGCINEFIEGGHPQCAVNPRTGFEDVLPAIPAPTDHPRKIGVVGAGPAGIVFAVNAARRGHTVELIEKEKTLGGKVVPGSVPLVKYDFANYLTYLQEQVQEAQKLPNFTLHLGTEATDAWLKKQGYDVVVFAVGTKNFTPPIPGIDKVRTVQATDLLTDDAKLGQAKKIVVVGGGVVGCETAYWLKYEKGCDVTVVEMLPHFMQGACTANRGHLIYYMKKAGVRLLNCAKVVSFDAGKVNICRNVSKGAPDPYNTWQPILPENIPNPLAKKLGPETKEESLDAELVVLAMGGKPDDAQFYAAQSEHVASELYNIGDSYAAGRVLEAARAAYNLAMRI